jgi:hypothetical protein
MKKSKNDANRDRYGDELKHRRLKATKAKRHSIRQTLHDITGSDLSDIMDSFNDEYGSMFDE